jgi:hypothetical protein
MNMKHLGYINAEGGPLLIMDANVSCLWKGTADDGSDYARACQLFDSDPGFEGVAVPIGDGAGMLWEMKGPGTAHAFMGDHLVIVRTWPVNPDDNTIPEKLAKEPMAAHSELGQIRVTTGVVVVLWSAESGACVRAVSVPPDGRPTGPTAVGSSGLLLKVDTGTYRCLHDQLETKLGVARRLHLVLMS